MISADFLKRFPPFFFFAFGLEARIIRWQFFVTLPLNPPPPQRVNEIGESEGEKNEEEKKKMRSSLLLNNYRTDDVAILRSFVICQAALTLR